MGFFFPINSQRLKKFYTSWRALIEGYFQGEKCDGQTNKQQTLDSPSANNYKASRSSCQSNPPDRYAVKKLKASPIESVK